MLKTSGIERNINAYQVTGPKPRRVPVRLRSIGGLRISLYGGIGVAYGRPMAPRRQAGRIGVSVSSQGEAYSGHR